MTHLLARTAWECLDWKWYYILMGKEAWYDAQVRWAGRFWDTVLPKWVRLPRWLIRRIEGELA